MARTIGSDGEKTQNAIREAAVRLIARRGFEAVSMRLLAAEVGVQAAALYRYFPNKEELLFSLMREHMRGLTAAWETAARRAAIPPRGSPPSPPITSGFMSGVGIRRMSPTWSCAACRTADCRRF